jgi:hypothetical protein
MRDPAPGGVSSVSPVTSGTRLAKERLEEFLKTRASDAREIPGYPRVLASAGVWSFH